MPDAMSLVISQALPSGVHHVYVPPRVLAGLLPEALLQQYQFWQVSPTRLVGKHAVRDDAGEPTLQVEIVTSSAVPGCSATVTRAVPAEQVAAGASSGAVWQLLDIAHAPADSLLHRLATVLSRIENVSHTLVWGLVHDSSNRSEAGFPMCEVALVDLPRLKTQFKPQVDRDGELRLYCLAHDGLFVSDTRSQQLSSHVLGIPFCIVLENSNHAQFVLTPSFALHRPRVRSLPLSTHLIPHRSSEWAAKVPTRVFVYPVHACGEFLQISSLSSAL